MSVRKRKGRPGWYFKHRDPKTKKEYFRYGGPTRRAAQVAERKLIQELEKSSGKFPGDDDLNNFIETDYWPSQKNHLTPKGAERERGILNKHLGPDFSGPMSKITRAKLIAYIDKRLNHDHASRESVRKELTVFKHALRIAVKIQLLARNPFEDLEQKDWPPKGEERTRHLVGDEWPRLIAEVPRIMRPAAAVLVNTGIRRGELMGIKRTDINLDAGMAYLGRTKNGKPRWFRLSPELVEMLKELPTKEGEPKVFWMFTANALTVAVSRAIKRAGLQDFRLHDLRYVLSLIMC